MEGVVTDPTIRRPSERAPAGSGDRLTTPELRAWRGFLRAHAQVLGALDDELQHREGIGTRAYEVLILLQDAPGGRRRISDLSRDTLLSVSGTSRLVDRLTRDGLVAKEACEEDRRGAWVRLTPAGHDLLGRARALHRAGVRRLFLDRLGDGELAALAAVWDVLGAGDPPG